MKSKKRWGAPFGADAAGATAHIRDTDDIGSNPTDNTPLDEIIRIRLSRRQALRGGLAAAAAGFFGQSLLGSAPAAIAGEPTKTVRKKPGRSSLGFVQVPPSTDDTVHVAEGYTWDLLIPWGTPLFPDGPAWRKDASNTAADQEKQVGFNHDGMHLFPLGSDGQSGLLVVNHEYTDANQIYTAAQGVEITNNREGREKVYKALAAHGVTVVEIRKGADGPWHHVQDSPYNRRITGFTLMDFSGPVRADHPMLQAPLNPPRGTLNNCANGHTPWGTYLACEENFNNYFGTDDTGWTPTPLEERYGVSADGSSYDWHKANPRFDLAKNRNEVNRFGWVVEIDPTKPKSTPVKRTALGRLKHEGATVVERDGRVVVYMGDDETGDYLYRYVSNAPWRKLRAQGKSPLDEGTLSVAQFSEDGTGTWLPLVHGKGPLTEANGFADQADVLIRTRQAADAVGATPLHRPEWVAFNHLTGDAFVSLTNGSGHLHPVNSNRDPNPYGHIVRFRDVGPLQATKFEWDVFIFAGDPIYPAGEYVPRTQPLFGSPDGLGTDPDGRLWILTDVSNSAQLLDSRGYDRIGNNQLLACNPATGVIKRFLTGPRGCEITGFVITEDQKTLFVNVQHPGESTTFWNTLNGEPSPENPRTVSNWPDHDSNSRPRPATVVIRKLDGGKIGT